MHVSKPRPAAPVSIAERRAEVVAAKERVAEAQEVRGQLPSGVSKAPYKFVPLTQNVPVDLGHRAHRGRANVAAHLVAFSRADRAMVKVLGEDPRLGRLKLRLPEGPVPAGNLVAALSELDVRPLVRAGVKPIATFDFDKTAFHGDVLIDFIELAAARGAFSDDGRAAVLERLATIDHPALPVAELDELSTNEILGRVVALTRKRDESGQAEDGPTIADLFHTSVLATRGLTVERGEQLADELFLVGAPGRKPYSQRMFDASPGEGDSSADVVRTLAERGVTSYIISAGLGLLARRGAKQLDIPADRVIASELRAVGGVFTGHVFDVVGAGKARLIAERIGVPPLFAFGDTPYSDGQMLALARGKGFMVDPPATFPALADKHGLDLATMTFKATSAPVETDARESLLLKRR